jgi:hypothetical protein
MTSSPKIFLESLLPPPKEKTDIFFPFAMVSFGCSSPPPRQGSQSSQQGAKRKEHRTVETTDLFAKQRAKKIRSEHAVIRFNLSLSLLMLLTA